MLTFIRDVKVLFNHEIKILNLGGGYGVRYVESDPNIDISNNLKLVGQAVSEVANKLNVSLPKIILEPGRSIVANAGMTIYEVGSFKTILEYKNYISIDGGMTDNPRYALYGSKYTVINASNPKGRKDTVATIAGRCCESGDLIQEDVEIQTPKRGDYLAVLVTGAYNYSMASNYNKIPKPLVLGIENNKEKVLVKRQTLEDMINNEL